MKIGVILSLFSSQTSISSHAFVYIWNDSYVFLVQIFGIHVYENLVYMLISPIYDVFVTVIVVTIGFTFVGKRRALIPPSVGYVNENLKPIPEEVRLNLHSCT
jgi:hypothetical protein